MATPKAMMALKRTKQALEDIRAKLEPVIQRLKADAFDKSTAQAHATVALSIGMMKYMGARLQGVDKGRKADDPLRQELNQMRKVLAEIKARNKDTKEREPQSQPSGKAANMNKKAPLNSAKALPIVDSSTAKSKSHEPNSATDTQEDQSGNKKRNADGSKRRSKKAKSK